LKSAKDELPPVAAIMIQLVVPEIYADQI
jgi:hypothetical protein